MDLQSHPDWIYWRANLAEVIYVLMQGEPKCCFLFSAEELAERVNSREDREYRDRLPLALEVGVSLGLMGQSGSRYHITVEMTTKLTVEGVDTNDVKALQTFVERWVDPVGEPIGPYFNDPPRLEVVERAILKIVREHEVPKRKRRDGLPNDELRKLLIHLDRVTAESPLLGVVPTIGISFNELAARVKTEFPGITVGDFVVVLERHLTDHRPDLTKNDREKAMQLVICPSGGGDTADAVESLLEQELLRVELRITDRQEESWVVLRIGERAGKKDGSFKQQTARRARRSIPKSVETKGRAKHVEELLYAEQINDTGKSLTQMLAKAGVSHEVFNKSLHFKDARAHWQALKTAREVDCSRRLDRSPEQD